MGLAASQAQLLSLTARISDNELRAQLISNSKMRLATESGQVNERYVQALNGAQLMFTNYDADNKQNYQKLTFNALTSYSQYNNQYGLSTLAGKLLVSEAEAKNFTDAMSAGSKALDAFLKLHGLEYKTTYFDNLKDKVNKSGHVEYRTTDHLKNVVMKSSGYTPDQLKKMYEGESLSGIHHQGYDTTIPTMKQYEFLVSEVQRTENALKAKLQPMLDAFTVTRLGSAGIDKGGFLSSIMDTSVQNGKTVYSAKAKDDNVNYRDYLILLQNITGSALNNTTLSNPGIDIIAGGDSAVKKYDYITQTSLPVNNRTDNNNIYAGYMDTINKTLKPKMQSPTGIATAADVGGDTSLIGLKYWDFNPTTNADCAQAPFRIFLKETTNADGSKTYDQVIKNVYRVYKDPKANAVMMNPFLANWPGFTQYKNGLPPMDDTNSELRIVDIATGSAHIPSDEVNYVFNENNDMVMPDPSAGWIPDGSGNKLQKVTNPDGTFTYNIVDAANKVIASNISPVVRKADGKFYDKNGTEVADPSATDSAGTGFDGNADPFTSGLFYNIVQPDGKLKLVNFAIKDLGFSNGTLTFDTRATQRYKYSHWTGVSRWGKTGDLGNYGVSEGPYGGNWNNSGQSSGIFSGNGYYDDKAGPLNGLEKQIPPQSYQTRMKYDPVTGNMLFDDTNDRIPMYNDEYYEAYKNLAESFIRDARKEYEIDEMLRAGYIKRSDAPAEFAAYYDALSKLSDFLYGENPNSGHTPLQTIDGVPGCDPYQPVCNKKRLMSDPEQIREHYDITTYPHTQKALDVIDYYYLDKVFNTYGEPKYEYIDTANPNENNAQKTQWYTNLFNRMLKGYQALEDGLASGPEWIKYALESGLVKMEQADKNGEWSSFTYNNCVNITEKKDQLAVTQAEAEYKRAMDKIQSKDKRYDMELKNIDTEHNSLQTEYDSIKAAIDKNVERTFKIYSA
ncbi:MAG: hypothetical protein LBK53_03260 [Heliobacteriaceae bacterium]|jgi:hypothetical protein|nr:hypothetical protein [Heliobacteriaceae bacterium]